MFLEVFEQFANKVPHSKRSESRYTGARFDLGKKNRILSINFVKLDKGKQLEARKNNEIYLILKLSVVVFRSDFKDIKTFFFINLYFFSPFHAPHDSPLSSGR
jgi:hypothetical protein